MSPPSDGVGCTRQAWIATALLAVSVLSAFFLTGSIPIVVVAAIGVPLPGVPVLAAIAFWIWIRPARLRAPMGTWRTVAFLVLVTLASACWFSVGWEYGLRYLGPGFTYSRAMLSAGFLLACALFCRRSLRAPSPLRSLWAHWLMSLWALGFAFPWLGEM